MKLTSIREAACIQGINLLNQLSAKKGYKNIAPEINNVNSIFTKLSEYFGLEFDKHVYKSLIEEIDFKDQKLLEKNKNTSNKLQFLIQEFPNFLKKPDFINLFSQILNIIVTNCSAKEIFEGLTKLLKLNIENQFKLLLSFFYSMNEKFQKEAISIFIARCNDYDPKTDKLSKEIVQQISLLINSVPELRNENLQRGSFSNLLYFENTFYRDEFNYKDNKLDCIEEYEKLMFSKSTDEEAVPFEKLIMELGPFIINNNINLTKCGIIDFNIDEKRFVSLLIYLCKNQSFTENKETQVLNKFFLKSLQEVSINIDENSEKKIVNWNIDNLFKFMKPNLDSLNIEIIFNYFDDPLFNIKDKKSFEFMLNILNKLKPMNYQNLFYNLIFKKWNNELNQIEFINFLINLNQSDLFSFKNAPRKLKKMTDYLSQTNKNVSIYCIDTWSCLDLIEILIKLSKGNYYLKIKEIFDWPIQNISEILIVSLSHIKVDEDDFLYFEIVSDILPNFINNFQNWSNVLEEVWNTNNELVIQALCYSYRNNPDVLNLSKILDLTQKLKDSLIQVSTCNDHNFTVNLGILSAKRDYLRLEQWLSERINTVGDDFIAALLNYLKENIINQCKDVTNQSQKENILEKSQLSLDSLAKIFENLSGSKIKNNPKVSKYMQNEISQTFHPIMELFEELQTHPPNSEEIEEEANKFFNNLFINENYAEIINILIQYKSSQNQKESEIYACMVHCLLDEYRFLHSYPDKELKLMAILFGQMIQNNLLDGILESIALKYVLEGIKKGNGKMLTFGTIALEQFIEKLAIWPNYVNLLYAEKPILLKANQKICQKIEEKYNEIFNKNKQTPAVDTQANKNQTVLGQTTTYAANYINFESDKKNNSVNNNLSAVPKMAKVQEGEFFNNYNTLNKYPYNIAPTNNQYMNYIPGQSGSFKQTSITQPKDNTTVAGSNNMFYQQNMNFYNPDMNNVYLNNNPFFNNFPQQDSNKKFISNNPINNPSMLGVKNEKDYFREDFKDTEFGMDQRLNRFKSGDKDIQQNASAPAKPFDEYDIRTKSSKASEDSGKLPNFPKEITDPDISSFNSNDKGTNNQTQPRLKLNPNVANKQMNLLTVLKNEIEPVPPQEIIDKVNLTFNSLSKGNLNEKSSDLKKIILNNDNVLKWFSKFFILHRIVNEMNYHLIYRDLIDLFQSKELNNLLINDSITIIKKLLTSETILDSSEKNFLKHLGNWLGLMTLAKNKPILAKDLDLKEIIFEAYENGKLMAVVPLVIKVLESSSKTKVFHSKNPWIIAILSVLKELSQKPSFKKQIYYEIENLFKKLEVDIKTIPETKELEQFTICQNSNDFYKIDDPTTVELKVADLFPIVSSGSLDQYIFELQNYLNQVDYTKPIIKADLTYILALALCNAINEILAPVVDRAVNISLVTTRDLVLKDFSLEKDEKKFKNAAYLCIKSLAGSLAMVTCKEPLRTNFTSNLKEQLIKKGYESEYVNEHLINANNNDILEIGCNYIQNYVVKKAIDKIDKDKIIRDELAKRKNQKPEEKNEMLKKMKNLPDLLRPNINGLTSEQYKIYEDFDKVYEINKKDTQKNNAFIRMIIPAVKEYFDTLQYQGKIAVKNYELCMKNIELLYNKHENIDFSEDDENLSQLSKIISDSKIGNDFVIELLQTNFKYIIIASKFTNPSLLIIYCEILKGWVKIHPMLSREATLFLMRHEEMDIRFKHNIHYHLIKKGILDMDTYESCLLSLMKDPLNSLTARSLVENLVSSGVVKEFKMIPSFMYDTNSSVYYEIFFNKTTPKQNINLSFLTDAKIFNIKDQNSLLQCKEKMVQSFREVMKCICNQETHEILKYNEITNLRNEDHLNIFIVLLTEYAIQNCFYYNESNLILNDRLNFSEIDTLTTFCIWLLKHITVPNKLKYFENILFAFFKAFHFNYVKNINTFNQRPFYRIFIYLCYFFYNNSNDSLFSTYKKFYFYFVLADFLKMIKPQNYPGFAFAWLDIISSKYFSSIFFEIEKSGDTNMPIKYEKYISLILELFNFLRLNASEKLRDQSQRLFLNSVYKFLYSLLKSYPEFLSYYYLPLINALGPYNFSQLKNIILSATPNEIEQPDPYVSEFKIDTLPDIKNCPQYLFNINYMLNDLYSTSLEDYFKTKNEKYLDELIKNLNKKDIQTNYQTINLICSYILQKNINMDRNQKVTELYEIFSKLLICLNYENRDLFINAIINELRFPNKHTFYTVVTFLNLLKDIKNEAIEENLLKNLYERLLSKPFSWGVYVTYFEINKYIGKSEFQKRTFLKNFGVDKFLEDMTKYVSESKLNKSLINFISS